MNKKNTTTGLLLAAAVALTVVGFPSEAQAKRDPNGYAANQAAVSMWMQQQAQQSGQVYNPYVNGGVYGAGQFNASANPYNANVYGAYGAYGNVNGFNPYSAYNPYGYNNVNGGYNTYVNNNVYDPYGYNNQFGQFGQLGQFGQFGNNGRLGNLQNILQRLF